MQVESLFECSNTGGMQQGNYFSYIIVSYLCMERSLKKSTSLKEALLCFYSKDGRNRVVSTRSCEIPLIPSNQFANIYSVVVPDTRNFSAIAFAPTRSTVVRWIALGVRGGRAMRQRYV